MVPDRDARMTLLRRVLREPLVHFLAIGAALFLWFAWRGDGTSSGRIVVTQGRIEHLAAGFQKTWQRQPSETELTGLIDEFVREEIATREAEEMGLDADDTIIRRRLRQKLEFLVEDAAVATPPTDEELRRYLDEHPDAFRLEPRLSIRQVYVSRDRRGEGADAEVSRVLAELRAAGPDVAIDEVGDALMAPQEMELATPFEIERSFGDRFAAAVVDLPSGEWSGPIESGYGPHLVLVRERVEGGVPELDAVRQKVERELLDARRREQLEAMYKKLLEKYEVRIDLDEEGEDGT